MRESPNPNDKSLSRKSTTDDIGNLPQPNLEKHAESTPPHFLLRTEELLRDTKPIRKYSALDKYETNKFDNEKELMTYLISLYKRSNIMFYSAQEEIRHEKNVLVNEFKDLGEKLRRIKEKEKKTHTRRHSLSKVDKVNEELPRNHEHEDSEIFQIEILSKLDELNNKYQNLANNISVQQKVPVLDQHHKRSKTNLMNNKTPDKGHIISLEPPKDKISLHRHNYSTTPNKGIKEQIVRQAGVKTPTGKASLDMRETDSGSIFNGGREKYIHDKVVDMKKAELERERDERLKRIDEEERDLENQRESLTQQKRRYFEYERELKKVENNLNERSKQLKANEDEFETLTQRLEKQSEDLAHQKMEFTKMNDALHKKIEQFKTEKGEFIHYEKEFNEKNTLLRSEQEQLVRSKEDLQNKQVLVDEGYRSLMAEYEEFREKQINLDRREQEIIHKERILDERSERTEEGVQTLNKEREEFISIVDLAEKRLKEREDDLNEREIMLNARKEKYDDFDLKLLGMKLNEEVWQKRRDLEVESLQEENKKMKDREKELHKREERLKLLEGSTTERKKSKDFKGKRESDDGNTSIHTLSFYEHMNDKSLLPLSSRTMKTDLTSRENTEN